jgi:hypothetical protein
MIEGGWILWPFDFAAVFFLVEIFYATVDSKMDGFVKVYQMRSSVGASMFTDGEVAGVGYCHGNISFFEPIYDIEM